MIRGLIFDFDGLIIDTEGPAFQAWQEIFAAHGRTLTLDTWSDYVGAATGSFPAFERLEAELGRPVDRDALLGIRQARKAELAAALPLRPGVGAWIAAGRALGLRLAIASSGPCAWVHEHLARLGLAGAFDCIRCADDVAAAKPAPDLYLAVLDALDLAPDEVLALEDSPNGIAAARAAGITCLAVPNPITGRLDLSRADRRIESLADVPLSAVLAELGRTAGQ